MILFLHCIGDEKVGIEPTTVTIDFGGVTVAETEKERIEVKEQFKKAIADFDLFSDYQHFMDECVECQVIFKEGNCKNPKCCCYVEDEE